MENREELEKWLRDIYWQVRAEECEKKILEMEAKVIAAWEDQMNRKDDIMTKDDYVSRALGALAWNPDPPDPRDVEAATRCAGDCFDKGFTLSDAIRFLSVLEHVDETVPEEIALRRMKFITEKYR